MRTQRGFTLTEILIVSGLMAFLGLFIGQLFLGGTRQFNESLWRNQTQQSLDGAAIRISKALREASYPLLNTFSGTVRDKRSQYQVEIKAGNLNLGNAYAQATVTLAGGDPQVDAAAADTIEYFGAGTRTDISESETARTDLMEWVSCEPAYRDVPGFEGAPQRPLCARYELYLEGFKQVMRANESSYQYYSDLVMETSFSYAPDMTPTNVLQGEGMYNASFVSTAGGPLKPEHLAQLGKKRLASSVASVAVKLYDKANDRSRTLELDIVCVAPWIGNAVVRKTFQTNVGVVIKTP